MNWDELLLFASSLLLVYAIVRRVIVTVMRRSRAPRETIRMALVASWQQFRADGLRGEEIILLALLLPALQLTVYYLQLLFDVGDPACLQVKVARPAVFTLNFILTIYFLNGRLTRAARGLIERWKRQPPQS